MKEIFVETTKREELIDITNLVEEKLEETKIKEGIVHLFTPHATCGLTINENADENLPKDISNFLNGLVKKGIWLHDRIDDNADAHIKTSIIGNSLMIPFKDNKLKLGTWQNIFLCEFDGPRKRKVLVSFLEEK
ncbi:MAG: secondary thiamine-phosphate synthase enzyme YjbQ [Candidatus Pacearchaeota archaeon]